MAGLSTTDCYNRRVYPVRLGDRREPPQREAATASRPPESKAKPEAPPAFVALSQRCSGR
jgi:hypothetical protein